MAGITKEVWSKPATPASPGSTWGTGTSDARDLMPSEDLGLPGPHGAGQPGQLRDPDAVSPAVEAVQCGAGRRPAGRGIDAPQQFLALPGPRDPRPNRDSPHLLVQQV
jgi:hypothetical protein